MTSPQDPSTWIKYKKGLCRDCVAGCCSLPVEAKLSDLIRMEVVSSFDTEQPPKQIAKALKKAGLIDHFNAKNGVFTLARLANNDCIYLDQQTRRCTIYAQRPDVCRSHPRVGPRPGFCSYKRK